MKFSIEYKIRNLTNFIEEKERILYTKNEDYDI